MIKSDAQRDRTLAQLDGFKQASNSVADDRTKKASVVRASYANMIRQLEGELREYEQLKAGKITLPDIERLDHIAPFLTRLRISKGLSQTDLAQKLGISKQVISRYEESAYQTVGLGRLQEILDALGVELRITLSA